MRKPEGVTRRVRQTRQQVAPHDSSALKGNESSGERPSFQRFPLTGSARRTDVFTRRSKPLALTRRGTAPGLPGVEVLVFEDRTTKPGTDRLFEWSATAGSARRFRRPDAGGEASRGVGGGFARCYALRSRGRLRDASVSRKPLCRGPPASSFRGRRRLLPSGRKLGKRASR